MGRKTGDRFIYYWAGRPAAQSGRALAIGMDTTSADGGPGECWTWACLTPAAQFNCSSGQAPSQWPYVCLRNHWYGTLCLFEKRSLERNMYARTCINRHYINIQTYLCHYERIIKINSIDRSLVSIRAATLHHNKNSYLSY